jgi:peptide-methionine (S)-S-oxide reductase
MEPSTALRETATLAGGCFWCVEALFRELRGIESAISGYTGGDRPDPSYRQVCGGDTGHAEAVQITFNPAVIPYEDILRIFFSVHDPTTLNRQGADEGTQYRSAIFYHDAVQKAAAERIIRELAAQKVFPRPIVTEVVPLKEFYRAEDYHQDYYAQNTNQGYCQFVIDPKLAKFRAKYANRLNN